MTMIARGCSETFGKLTNIYAPHFEQLITYPAFKEFMEATQYQSE